MLIYSIEFLGIFSPLNFSTSPLRRSPPYVLKLSLSPHEGRVSLNLENLTPHQNINLTRTISCGNEKWRQLVAFVSELVHVYNMLFK